MNPGYVSSIKQASSTLDVPTKIRITCLPSIQRLINQLLQLYQTFLQILQSELKNYHLPQKKKKTSQRSSPTFGYKKISSILCQTKYCSPFAFSSRSLLTIPLTMNLFFTSTLFTKDPHPTSPAGSNSPTPFKCILSLD
jgi:hypothetical protein